MLSSNLRNFSVILRFVAIYALYGRLWAKKLLFWVKNSAYYILYWIKFAILQIRKKWSICCQNSKYAPNKKFCGHFLRGCHPGSNKQKKQKRAYWHRCVVCVGRKGVGYKCEHAGLPRIRWSFQPSLRFVCSASVISHARQQANGQRKSKLKWKWTSLLGQRAQIKLKLDQANYMA